MGNGETGDKTPSGGNMMTEGSVSISRIRDREKRKICKKSEVQVQSAWYRNKGQNQNQKKQEKGAEGWWIEDISRSQRTDCFLFL